MNILIKIVRRIKQKVLFEQICEFLESKYCIKKYYSNRNHYRFWLMELTCHTNARNMRGITDSDLRSFLKYIVDTESSAWYKEEVPKIIRKFFLWGKQVGHVYGMPEEMLQFDDKKVIIEDMRKRIKKTPGQRLKAGLIERIRAMHDDKENGMSFQKIADILNKELNKTYDRQAISRYYHNPRVAF